MNGSHWVPAFAGTTKIECVIHLIGFRSSLSGAPEKFVIAGEAL